MAGIGVAITRRYRQNESLQTTRKGLIPGFSTTDGEHLNLDPNPDWIVERLHEYHVPNRTRLVLVVKQTNDDANPAAIAQTLARTAHANTNAQAVFVRVINEEGQSQYRCLYAPDRAGWSGNEHVEFVGQKTHA